MASHKKSDRRTSASTASMVTGDLAGAGQLAMDFGAVESDSGTTANSDSSLENSELALFSEPSCRSVSGPDPQQTRGVRRIGRPRTLARGTVTPWPGEQYTAVSSEAAPAQAEPGSVRWYAPEHGSVPSVAAAFDLDALRRIVHLLEALSQAYPTPVPLPLSVPPIRPRGVKRRRKSPKGRVSGGKRTSKTDSDPVP
jgi:hypothetical protein